MGRTVWVPPDACSGAARSTCQLACTLSGREAGSIESGFSARGTGLSAAMAPAALKLRTSTFVFGLAGDVPVVARTSGKSGYIVPEPGFWTGTGKRRWDAGRPPIRFRDSHGLAAHRGCVPDSHPGGHAGGPQGVRPTGGDRTSMFGKTGRIC